MFEYFLISVAVLLFVGQFAFTKIYQCNVKQTLATTLSFLIVTSLVGAAIFLIASGFKIEFTSFSLTLAVMFAICMIPYFLIGIKILSIGSMAIYSMFMMLGGMLLPFFYGTAFLSEPITVGKGIGCVLLSASMILQAFSQNDAEKQQGEVHPKRGRIVYFLLCMAGFVINGLTAVIAKAHQININAVSEENFSFIYCLLTAVMSVVLLIVTILGKNRDQIISELKATIEIKPLLVMCAVGFWAYVGNYLVLLAASKVPASVQYPMISGGVIVLSAFASMIFFKEKVSNWEWVSIFGSFVATFLFAF